VAGGELLLDLAGVAPAGGVTLDLTAATTLAADSQFGATNLTISGGALDIESATDLLRGFGSHTIHVASGSTLVLTAQQADRLSVDGQGDVSITGLAQTPDVNLDGLASSLHVTAQISADVDLSGNPHLWKIDSYALPAALTSLAVAGVTAVGSGSNDAHGEGVGNAVDGSTSDKYLNFAGPGSGLVADFGVGKVVTSFQITTANDASGRDPASYVLEGSNDDHNFTAVASGSLSLPDARQAESDYIGFDNTTAYQYYRLVFPDLKNNSEMLQIAEVKFFDQPVPDPAHLTLGAGQADATGVTGTGTLTVADAQGGSHYDFSNLHPSGGATVV
jgi:hypothetical protein